MKSFAGYRRYVTNDMAAHFNWLPKPLRRLAPRLVGSLAEGGRDNSTGARVKRLAHVLAMEPNARYAHWMSAFPTSMRDDVLQPEFLAATDSQATLDVIGDAWSASSATSRVDRMLDTDVNTYLPADLLVKMDIATMAYSVEGRSPFLDHHLMEFAAALSPKHKLHGVGGKLILKSALRGIVPDEILDRPKMGFGVPLSNWFRGELRDLPGEILMGSDSRVHAYVKPEAIAMLIEQHQQRAADHSLRLWALLQLELWHREVVESPIPRSATLA